MNLSPDKKYSTKCGTITMTGSEWLDDYNRSHCKEWGKSMEDVWGKDGLIEAINLEKQIEQGN